MKRIIFLGFSTVLTLLLFSCSKEKERIYEPVSKIETKAKEQARLDAMLAIARSPQRASSEAFTIARSMLGDGGGTKTRGSAYEMDYILTEHTSKGVRSVDGNTSVDTALYIINKKNDGGFCIVSGDKRIPGLLAFSDNGHINKDSIDGASALAVFLSRLPAFSQMKVDKFQKELNNLQVQYNRPEKPIDHFQYETIYTEWEEVYRKKEFVPVEWGQDSPYNDNAPVFDGKHALAGCVTTATAQILATHKYPKTFAGMTYDWSLLTSDLCQDNQRSERARQLAYLFRKIGDALGNSWGVASTSAKTSDVPKLLQQMGYKHPSQLTRYNRKGIIASLENNNPVLMRGNTERHVIKRYLFWIVIGEEVVYTGGHAWVCDGYVKRERSYITYDVDANEIADSGKEHEYYLHCNWGWGGMHNGYFFDGVFDAEHKSTEVKETPKYEFQSTDGGNSSLYFQYNIENILDIHP